MWINPDRDYLYNNINTRVDDMFDMGWIDEVKKAFENGAKFDDPGILSLGYRDIYNHLQGEISYDNMVKDIKQQTRKYAKRQLTYFRNQYKGSKIQIVNPNK